MPLLTLKKCQRPTLPGDDPALVLKGSSQACGQAAYFCVSR